MSGPMSELYWWLVGGLAVASMGKGDTCFE